MVRHFPRATRRVQTRRRALTALASIGLVVGVAGLPAAADDLDDKQETVEKKLDEQHDHVDESSAELDAATSAWLAAREELEQAQSHLAQTQGELAAAKALDEQMQRRLDAAIARLERAQAALDAGREEMTVQTDRLKQMVVAAYEQGDPALVGLSMVFTTQDPAQLAGNMNASSTVVNLESTILDQLEAAEVLLQVREDELQAAKADVAKKRKAAAENLVRKQALEDAAREAAARVSEMVTLRAEARATAVKAKNADVAALAKLQAERDRIAALIAAQAAQGTGTYAGPSGGNGYLSMPVDGSITSPYGWRTHPIWGYRSLHDGIDFGAGCGTPIRAAAPGTVLSTYYQSAWGNRIIVDHGVKHGVSLATISNHLSGYAVSEGEHVSRGEVIGYVGTTGWSTGCHLHWTVLQAGQPVDPMNWL
ncbi:MAG TPA: peptidoglycan DD-metalloendopeptidase family protein [Marmoricola sp.]|nr:peptidoglycan DD-metalloendopeptidase family protein [Marmoricola sp.]